MSKINNMSNKALNSQNAGSFRSAGNFVGYLLRSGETGLSCCTEILNDAGFLEQLDNLYEQQKVEFYNEFSPKVVAYWKSRDFAQERLIEAEKHAADPTYKVKNLDRAEAKRNVIVRKDAAFQSKPWTVRGGSKRAQEITNMVHKISTTQIYDEVRGRTGHQILQMLPNNATKEQVVHVIASIRAAMPADHPAVFTIHRDLKSHNLHLQGWISSKDWDSSKGEWRVHSRGDQSYFSTREAPGAIHQVFQTAMAEAGLKFTHADDASLPRITDSHPYVSELLRTRPKEDFVSGKVKDGMTSERARALCDQIGARVKAIDIKTATKAAEKVSYQKGIKFVNTLDVYESSRRSGRVNQLEKKAEFLEGSELDKMFLSDVLEMRAEQHDLDNELELIAAAAEAELAAAITAAKRHTQHISASKGL
jgi:hypothetical protein